MNQVQTAQAKQESYESPPSKQQPDSHQAAFRKFWPLTQHSSSLSRVNRISMGIPREAKFAPESFQTNVNQHSLSHFLPSSLGFLRNSQHWRATIPSAKQREREHHQRHQDNHEWTSRANVRHHQPSFHRSGINQNSLRMSFNLSRYFQEQHLPRIPGKLPQQDRE